MKQTITRADGITYERKPKEGKYGSIMYLRLTPKDGQRIKDIASEKGIKYSNLLRNIVENYLNESEMK